MAYKIDLSVMDKLGAVLPLIKPITALLGLETKETSLTHATDEDRERVVWVR